MKVLMLVAVGGALGSMARYTLSNYVLQHAAGWRFPAGTLAVNVLGCLLAGVLAALAVRHELLSADARIFLFTGLLGGFTTFSAFGLETMLLLKRGELLIAGTNVLLSVALGLAMVWLGMKLGAFRA